MLENIESEIETIISKSQVPEDSIHSKNTREWVLKLKPEADRALQMAALGHDIERSIEKRKIKRENFTDYNEFKKAHSQNSATLLQEILLKQDADQDFIDKVVHLVLLHEVGGTLEADILKDADSISFFDVNLPFYFQRNSEKETAFRMKWGYKKLSKVAKSIVGNFSYDNIELEALFNRIVS
ncbi:HD domain protein [bacterium BMS3Bbin03]|nr:HD domain protein [bacterium BMS3Bbin03]HDL78062.1 DUF4202 family protein [Bacteroidota bacterium]